MLALIVILAIYVASVISAYLLMRRDHMPGGNCSYHSPTMLNAVSVFIPGINTLMSVMGIIEYRGDTKAHRFFRLDKEEIKRKEGMQDKRGRWIRKLDEGGFRG